MFIAITTLRRGSRVALHETMDKPACIAATPAVAIQNITAANAAVPCCCHCAALRTYVTQYAVAARATSRHSTTTKAGSSLAHWFFVCLWYEVCRYLQQ
jgi:hypothetical protein